MQKKITVQHYPVTAHTDYVQPGGTFVALQGKQHNGADFIHQALKKGARSIVLAHSQLTPSIDQLCTLFNASLFLVDNPYIALAERAAHAWNYPANQLTIIGITGTKGKTITTHLIYHIIKESGLRVALLGTMNNYIQDSCYEHPLTTPNSDYLQMFFAECVQQKIDFVVMEVSSHAQALHRTHGIFFDAVGFTNLGVDHLDYHKTMEHYYQTKMSLLKQIKPNGLFVANTNNEWGNRAFIDSLNYQTIKSMSIGSAPTNTIQLKNCSEKQKQGTILSSSLFENTIHTPSLFGSFNVDNIGMALALCSRYNIPENTIIKACASFQAPSGRLESYTLSNGAQAFVDFAHVPMALEAVLSTLRPLTNHLLVVFGCGGDRDTTKRSLMGSIAVKYADEVILTDDNPRTENRLAIINDITSGISSNHYDQITIIPNRRKAIAYAAGQSTAESIIAVCGKGHENYYLIDGKTYFLSDLEELKKY